MQWLESLERYGNGPDQILCQRDAYLAVDLRYHSDRMGNVAFVLDGDGNGIERYTYDAFGAPTVTDWDGNNPRSYSWYGNRFMFTGREYYPEFGLYDYRNRFYQPVLGRFLQTDPTGFDAGDANLFRYCGGDPVNGIDPFGLDQGGGNDRAHDYDWNDREVWTSEVRVNGKSILAEDYWQFWLNNSPLSGYNNGFSLLNDDRISLNGDSGAGALSGRARVVLEGNVTQPGYPGVYTDNNLFKADGTPAAGLTHLALVPNRNGTVTLLVHTQINRAIAIAHPKVIGLEWEHVTLADFWVREMNRTGRYASPMMRQFADKPWDLATAEEIREFLQPSYRGLLNEENALDLPGGRHYRPDFFR